MNQAQNVTVKFSAITVETVIVRTGGPGSGTVNVSPTGTPLGGCSLPICYQYPYGATVTLTAVAAVGSVFTGWGSPLTSSPCHTNPCTLTLTSGAPGAYDLSAVFIKGLALDITKSGSGTGLVSSSDGGISCGSTCSSYYAPGAQITLTATPDPGSTFVTWTSSPCSTRTCAMTMIQDSTITAIFSKIVCVVPSLKGKRLSVAETAIGRAHCSVGAIAKAFSTTAAKGVVLSQSQRPGKRLKDGAAVALVVSKGKRG